LSEKCIDYDVEGARLRGRPKKKIVRPCNYARKILWAVGNMRKLIKDVV